MGKIKVHIEKPGSTVVRKVGLRGLSPIMFDRYAGDNATKLTPQQKLYLSPTDSETIGLPAMNIMSLLSAHNTNSAPKRFRDIRSYKKLCNACLAFVVIEPHFIPFLRDGEPLKFSGFEGEEKVCPTSGMFVHHAVARLDKGIPNPKERPVLPTPWELEFDLTLVGNNEIKEQELANLIQAGGSAIGLGTFRGVFGKFEVTRWE